jgi:hypothetical protein
MYLIENHQDTFTRISALLILQSQYGAAMQDMGVLTALCAYVHIPQPLSVTLMNLLLVDQMVSSTPAISVKRAPLHFMVVMFTVNVLVKVFVITRLGSVTAFQVLLDVDVCDMNVPTRALGMEFVSLTI